MKRMYLVLISILALVAVTMSLVYVATKKTELQKDNVMFVDEVEKMVTP